MAQLAIKGHATRGKEVIEILEMLGGKNKISSDGLKWFNGTNVDSYYTIEEDNYIHMRLDSRKGDYIKFTLEEFLEKFPYKVGDKVTHNFGILMTVVHMSWDAECNVVRYDIQSPVDNNYKLKAMLAEHLQPYKEENMKEELEQITLDIPKGYEFFGINDDNQVVLAKKQPQYPKTYEECCKVISVPIRNSIGGHKWKILQEFQKLIVCRDAYWKIAGEQMGLGKTWAPDFLNPTKEIRYFLFCTGITIENGQGLFPTNKILIFPTQEMRDAQKEYFKTKDNNVLLKSKELEHKVDSFLAQQVINQQQY